ncbi:MAG: prepilin-type N-terminal cleavage/methylation domain [Herbinix sp.]|jgi:type IV pilus assembly protein PilA|nr:prepilin-type N-terminal cleavage/methylation domain [Herbinix sp.]
MMKKGKNNKGFSLVELIVVMAIMAILAVTLAPRLSEYVEKAKVASDREVINSIYTAVKYGILDETTLSDAQTLTGTEGYELNDKETDDTDGDESHESLYEVNGRAWTIDTNCDYISNKLINEINKVVGNFKLKSNKAVSATQIIITITGTDHIVSVTLDYDGNYLNGTDYTLSDDTVR